MYQNVGLGEGGVSFEDRERERGWSMRSGGFDFKPWGGGEVGGGLNDDR